VNDEPSESPPPAGFTATVDTSGDRGDDLVTDDGATDDTPVVGPTTRPRSKGLRSLVEWIVVIAVALLVALVIRTWVFQPFWIPSGSMEDTLDLGDRVLVNKLSYRLHDINRGDVVVFDRPEEWLLGDDVKHLIKRVVGVEGDTIRIEDCSVFVNGKKAVEPYVDGQCTTPADAVVDPDRDGEFVVPDDKIFVMGDNRGGSNDSRVNGFVGEDDVVGRAFVVIWPRGHWRWL
jgi:signal peptidase I